MPILRVSIVLLAIAVLCPMSLGSEITNGDLCEDDCSMDDVPKYSEGSDGTISESKDLMQDSAIEKEKTLMKEMEELQEKLFKEDPETQIEETSKIDNQEMPDTDQSKNNNHMKRDLNYNDENNSAEEELIIGVKMKGTSGEEEDVFSKHCRPEKDEDIAPNYIAISDKNMAGLYPYGQTAAYQISVQYPQCNPWYQMTGYPPFFSYHT